MIPMLTKITLCKYPRCIIRPALHEMDGTESTGSAILVVWDFCSPVSYLLGFRARSRDDVVDRCFLEI